MRKYTFPKSEKLQKNWEFQKVYKEGKKYTGEYCIIYALDKQPKRKVGIGTSKKIGNAVLRTRARRLIREAYRLNKHLLAEDTVLVICAKPEINDLKYKDVENDLVNIISKIQK